MSQYQVSEAEALVDFMEDFRQESESMEGESFLTERPLCPVGRYNVRITEGKAEFKFKAETAQKSRNALAEGKPWGAAAVEGASDCVNYQTAIGVYGMYSFSVTVLSEEAAEALATTEVKRTINLMMGIKWKISRNKLIPTPDPKNNIDFARLKKAADVTENLPEMIAGSTVNVKCTHRNFNGKLIEDWGDFLPAVEED